MKCKSSSTSPAGAFVNETRISELRRIRRGLTSENSLSLRCGRSVDAALRTLLQPIHRKKDKLAVNQEAQIKFMTATMYDSEVQIDARDGDRRKKVAREVKCMTAEEQRNPFTLKEVGDLEAHVFHSRGGITKLQEKTSSSSPDAQHSPSFLHSRMEQSVSGSSNKTQQTKLGGASSAIYAFASMKADDLRFLKQYQRLPTSDAKEDQLRKLRSSMITSRNSKPLLTTAEKVEDVGATSTAMGSPLSIVKRQHLVDEIVHITKKDEVALRIFVKACTLPQPVATSSVAHSPKKTQRRSQSTGDRVMVHKESSLHHMRARLRSLGLIEGASPSTLRGSEEMDMDVALRDDLLHSLAEERTKILLSAVGIKRPGKNTNSGATNAKAALALEYQQAVEKIECDTIYRATTALKLPLIPECIPHDASGKTILRGTILACSFLVDHHVTSHHKLQRVGNTQAIVHAGSLLAATTMKVNSVSFPKTGPIETTAPVQQQPSLSCLQESSQFVDGSTSLLFFSPTTDLLLLCVQHTSEGRRGIHTPYKRETIGSLCVDVRDDCTWR